MSLEKREQCESVPTTKPLLVILTVRLDRMLYPALEDPGERESPTSLLLML